MNAVSSYQLIKEINWRPDVVMSSSMGRIDIPGLPASVASKIGMPISVLNLSIVYHTELTPIVLNIFQQIYKPRNALVLEERTEDRFLSPLHIATISGNEKAVEQLIEAGVQIDGCDKFHWAAIHHAAMLGHKTILALLLAKGADIRVQTNRKATYQTIQSLVYPSAYKVDNLIRLFWKDEQGNCSQLTKGSYQQKTSAQFLDEYRVTQVQVFKTWSDLSKKKKEFPFVEQLKSSFEFYRQDPSSHVLAKVTKNSSGQILPFSPGLGIFAKEDVTPFQILGEYFGELVEDEGSVVDKEYLLNDVDGKKYRNEIAQINDGFCNTAVVSILDRGGLFTRYVLVAIEPIKAGDQFCWNYGFGHIVKEGPYIEFRQKEMRDFINEYSINYLVECYNKMVNKNASFEEFCLAEKISYVMNTPSVLFSLALEGEVTRQESLCLHNAYIGLLQECNCSIDPLYYSIHSIAMDCKYMQKRLVDRKYPETASFYMDYVRKLPEKKMILDALCFIKELNGYTSDYIGSSERLCDEELLFSLKEQIKEAIS